MKNNQEEIQDMLDFMVEKEKIAAVKNASFGWSTIFRFQNLDYVFEIGLHCGDVFSTNMVKSIELVGTGYLITLKS